MALFFSLLFISCNKKANFLVGEWKTQWGDLIEILDDTNVVYIPEVTKGILLEYAGTYRVDDINKIIEFYVKSETDEYGEPEPISKVFGLKIDKEKNQLIALGIDENSSFAYEKVSNGSGRYQHLKKNEKKQVSYENEKKDLDINNEYNNEYEQEYNNEYEADYHDNIEYEEYQEKIEIDISWLWGVWEGRYNIDSDLHVYFHPTDNPIYQDNLSNDEENKFINKIVFTNDDNFYEGKYLIMKMNEDNLRLYHSNNIIDLTADFENKTLRYKDNYLVKVEPQSEYRGPIVHWIASIKRADEFTKRERKLKKEREENRQWVKERLIRDKEYKRKKKLEEELYKTSPPETKADETNIFIMDKIFKHRDTVSSYLLFQRKDDRRNGYIKIVKGKRIENYHYTIKDNGQISLFNGVVIGHINLIKERLDDLTLNYDKDRQSLYYDKGNIRVYYEITNDNFNSALYE